MHLLASDLIHVVLDTSNFLILKAAYVVELILVVENFGLSVGNHELNDGHESRRLHGFHNHGSYFLEPIGVEVCVLTTC